MLTWPTDHGGGIINEHRHAEGDLEQRPERTLSELAPVRVALRRGSPLLPETEEGPGRWGGGQEGILEGSIPVLPTRPPTLVWEEGLVPGPGGGDINHRGAPVTVASGTKRKHLAKGQDFSPRAPGAPGPTTATPGGQGWEQGIWGSGQAAPLSLQQEAPPEAALELRAQE